MSTAKSDRLQGLNKYKHRGGALHVQGAQHVVARLPHAAAATPCVNQVAAVFRRTPACSANRDQHWQAGFQRRCTINVERSTELRSPKWQLGHLQIKTENRTVRNCLRLIGRNVPSSSVSAPTQRKHHGALEILIVLYIVLYCIVTDILSRTISELSQLTVQILDTLRFWATLWGLGTTYDVHLGLIGKRVADFLLVLIKLIPLGVTPEWLRAKIDRKSAITLQRGQFDPKFQVEGVAPANHFCTDSLALQLCSWQFSRKKLCSRLSSSDVRF